MRDSELFADERDRRRRGVRAPLDWYYLGRGYAFIVLVLVIGVVGGLQLLLGGPGWWHLAGPVVLAPSVWGGRTAPGRVV